MWCLCLSVPRAGVEIVDTEGQSTLRHCRPGHAKSRPGTYRCVRCPARSFTATAGQLHCRVCPHATTSNTARTACGASSLAEWHSIVSGAVA